jgi:hypothetical protein
MSIPFLRSIRFGTARIADVEVRTRLHRAILDNDGNSFRNILEQHVPEIAGEHGLYGVLAMTPAGMRPFLVNERGERIRTGYVIDEGTPIDFLNVEVGPTGMTATDLLGNVWGIQ